MDKPTMLIYGVCLFCICPILHSPFHFENVIISTPRLVYISKWRYGP